MLKLCRSKTSSSSSSKSGSKTSYKHIPHREKPAHLVAKRNARERRRVEAVNSAFARLRKCVPIENRNKRLSKVKTLQKAIEYIEELKSILGDSSFEEDSTEEFGTLRSHLQQQLNQSGLVDSSSASSYTSNNSLGLLSDDYEIATESNNSSSFNITHSPSISFTSLESNLQSGSKISPSSAINMNTSINDSNNVSIHGSNNDSLTGSILPILDPYSQNHSDHHHTSSAQNVFHSHNPLIQSHHHVHTIPVPSHQWYSPHPSLEQTNNVYNWTMVTNPWLDKQSS